VYRAWVPVAAALALLVLPGGAHAAGYAGRPVQEVLDEMHEAGLNIIYNTREIPPRLRIGAEPAATTPLEIAREILAPLGFRLDAVGDNVYSAVPDRQRSALRRPRPPAAPVSAGTSAAIEELVVTTSRYSLSADQLDVHTFLTQAELDALPKLGDEPIRAIQRLPGSAATNLSAQAHIRGGEYDEMLMVLDGMPMHEPFHLKNFLTPVTLFDARAIDSMDVYSGGFTANYGDRMSAVVDISTLTPPEERYTELGLSLFHTNALSAGTFSDERGEWLASVRRSNLDLIASVADSEVGDPEYFDAFGRLRYALSDATTVFGNVLFSRDEISANTSDEAEDTDAEYRNTYVWGGVEQELTDAFAGRLILALTDVDNQREGEIDEPGEHIGELNDRREFRMGMVKLDFSHEMERVFTRFGVELREMEAEYRYVSSNSFAAGTPLPGDPPVTIERNLAPEPEGHQYAAYLTSRWRIFERLSAEIGLRWDDQSYDEVSDPTQLSPRVNVMFDLTQGTRLRAAWGRFWQAQGINELQVEDGVETFYDPQRVDHAIASVEQKLPWQLDLRVEAYYKDYGRVRPHFENLFDPLALLPELEPDRVRVAPDGSRARGVEFSLARRGQGPWSWWLNYAWSRVTDDIDGADVTRSWDQRHTFNAGLTWSSERWDFTLTDSYHTGWPTTEVLVAPDPVSGADTAVVGLRNAIRYKNYNSVDFRAMRRWQLPESSLEAFFEVSNIFAERNPCCADYELNEAPGGGLEIERDWDYWPRMVPSLGVLWRF
jgi:outer membrane receptor protein involved in Fe transport